MADEKPKVSVSILCQNTTLVHAVCGMWARRKKNGHLHVSCFTLLKFRAEIQLLAIPTLIDRKVCERASTGAQVAFCLITHCQPTGVILSSQPCLPPCAFVHVWRLEDVRALSSSISAGCIYFVLVSMVYLLLRLWLALIRSSRCWTRM